MGDDRAHGRTTQLASRDRAKLPALVVATLWILVANPAGALADELGELSIEQLMTIDVVSASRRFQSQSDAPNIITVYTARDIQSLGATKVSDLLWLVAGVQVTRHSNNKYYAWFRGVRTEFNNKTALFVNDVPYRDYFGGHPIDEQLPIDAVKRIEIIRGPGSTMHGRSAFAGVISIYTYAPGELHTATVQTSVGNYGTRRLSLVADNSSEQGNLIVEAQLFNTDGEAPLRNRFGDPNDASRLQFGRNLRIAASPAELDLVVEYSYGSFHNQRIDKEPRSQSARHHTASRLSLTHTRKLGDGDEHGDLSFLAYFTKVHRNEFESSTSRDDQGTTRGLWEFRDVNEVWGSRINLAWPAFANNTLVVGAELEVETLRDSSYDEEITRFDSDGQQVDHTYNPNETFILDDRYRHLTATNLAAYIHDSWALFDNSTTINAGVRFDSHSVFEDKFSFRVGLLERFSQQWFGKLLFGTAYRPPSFLEFTRASPDEGSIPHPETMRTLEAQVGHRTARTQATLTAFHNWYFDYIDRIRFGSESEPDPAGENFANTLDQRSYGVELELRAFPRDSLECFLNASWLRAKVVDTGEHIALLAHATVAAGMLWRYPVGPGRLTLTGTLHAYGPRHDWGPGVQHLPGRPDSYSDGFAIVNAVAGYKLERGTFAGFGFRLIARNLANTIHYTQESGVRQTVPWDSQYEQRQLRLSIDYTW